MRAGVDLVFVLCSDGPVDCPYLVLNHADSALGRPERFVRGVGQVLHEPIDVAIDRPQVGEIAWLHLPERQMPPCPVAAASTSADL